MANCPFCQRDLEENMTVCPNCNARKAYLKIDKYRLGKSSMIFFGFILPFLIILFAISAQNMFGVWVSISMTLPMLFAIWQLILGPRWMQ